MRRICRGYYAAFSDRFKCLFHVWNPRKSREILRALRSFVSLFNLAPASRCLTFRMQDQVRVLFPAARHLQGVLYRRFEPRGENSTVKAVVMTCEDPTIIYPASFEKVLPHLGFSAEWNSSALWSASTHRRTSMLHGDCLTHSRCSDKRIKLRVSGNPCML